MGCKAAHSFSNRESVGKGRERSPHRTSVRYSFNAHSSNSREEWAFFFHLYLLYSSLSSSFAFSISTDTDEQTTTVLNRRTFILPFLFLLGVSLTAQEQGDSISGVPYLPPWNFMSLSTAGIDTFLINNPTYDGRGVLVLILDTGIDPSIPGLQQTSTGEPKVIDLVDVSGSNLVQFYPARRDGDKLRSDKVSVELKQFTTLDPQPIDDMWYIGVMDESRYQNSSIRDFDGDGESATLFGTLLYQGPDGWHVVVDADGDESLEGETNLRSYREDRETFTFPQKNDYSDSPITVGAEINSELKSVTFHYDMGGHGTHVAGIAAGYEINDEPGFNGVAPGAQLISVKFSSDPNDDLTIAGTMKRAYDYAAHLADSLESEGVPVLINMSFGIGSAYEGKAAMEEYINDLIPEHPNLYVVTSAGNEGPGISTVGIPASASQTIAVGALLPKGIGRDSYGAVIDQDILWDFSSRGGEVDKPDVVAPGTAISTIPRFSFDMRASGTSMASPYTAGVVALLLSAAKQEFPSWTPGQGLIRRALRQSANPLPGYALIEQGGGVVNVGRAWETLRRWKRTGYADSFQEYEISTFSPFYPDNEAFTSFWRSGFLPDGDWRQTFYISRRDVKAYESTTSEKDFFRPFTLESTAPWMKTIQKTVYIKGDDDVEVEVVYDRTKMTEPGLYSGKIVARRAKGKKPTPADEVEFELLNTLILPYRFSPENSYKVTTGSHKLKSGETKRFYFAIPSGALGTTFTLTLPKGSHSIFSGTITDRFGKAQGYLPHIRGSERTEGESTISSDVLGEGIIEVIIQADPMEGGGGDGEFTLTVEPIMLDIDAKPNATKGSSELIVTAQNTGTEPIAGKLEYTLKGYSRTVRDTIRNSFYRAPIKVGKHDGALWLAVRFAPEEYMQSTDIMIRLVDSSGQSQAQEVYNGPEEWVFLPNFYRDEEERWYFLEIVFGTAIPTEEGVDDSEEDRDFDDPTSDAIPFQIIEKHVRPTDFERLNGYSERFFYPYIPRTFTGEAPELEGGIPEGYYPLFDLRFEESGYRERVIEMEVGEGI